MYAFSIAVALQKMHIVLKTPPNSPFIVEPPAATEQGKAAMYHYTFGSIFLDSNDSKVFEFDKRFLVDKRDMYKVVKSDTHFNH